MNRVVIINEVSEEKTDDECFLTDFAALLQFLIVRVFIELNDLFYFIFNSRKKLFILP